MHPMTDQIVENIKFLEKSAPDKLIKMNELFEMCQSDGISGFTLDRVLNELSLAGKIFRPKPGMLVYFSLGVP